MRNFNKFGKYFAITFLIVFTVAFIWAANNKMDELIALPVSRILSICTLLVLAILTSLVCYSLSVATFLTFWNMNNQKWSDFFRSFAIGLIIVVPLSAGVYYYDWHVQAQLTTASTRNLIEMKEYGLPEEIENKFSIDIEQFLSELPGTLPKDKLLFRLDSLKAVYRTDADTCSRMLSCLPDSMAAEAYRAYRLEDLGIAYQCATTSTAGKDSLEFVQQSLLYQQALKLMETSKSLQRYAFEKYSRTMNTAWIYIAYILFAFSGYMLRHKPLRKILGVLAVLIISAYIFQEFSAYAKIQAKKVQSVANEAAANERDAYREIREQQHKKQKQDE
ncbi:MAG: hypothetical protein LUE99_00395 [Bacteroides sp.]|nr:hypothetical protein [Bacteroides sp.]